jgi:hypothetical protein
VANYTITPANVAYAGAGYSSGICGESLAAGEILALKASDGRYYKADANNAELHTPVGLALNGTAAAGQPVAILGSGEVTVGAIFAAAGKVLALSSTPGQLCDVADPTTGDRLVLMGWSTAVNKLRLSIADTGITL